MNTGETTIQIAPKIGIARALFLVTYALDPRAWKDHDVGAASDASSTRQLRSRSFATPTTPFDATCSMDTARSMTRSTASEAGSVSVTNSAATNASRSPSR